MSITIFKASKYSIKNTRVIKIENNFELKKVENTKYVNDILKINRELFPDWEKESDSEILSGIVNEKYILYILITKGNAIGFSILEKRIKLKYIFFSYLGIKKSEQGKKYGTFLCNYCLNDFNTNANIDYIIIEAENRQSLLYQKIGFEKINIKYSIPSFISMEDSVPANLLQVSKKKLNQKNIYLIVYDILICIYELDRTDKRVKRQLQQIKKKNIV